jgi:signal transduction histidine kinase
MSAPSELPQNPSRWAQRPAAILDFPGQGVSHRWRQLRPYAFAVFASALALVLTLLVDDPRVEPNTLLLFLAAVMCSSWYGGIGPGVVATGLTGLGALYLYIPPALSFLLDEQSALRLVEFVAVSVLISVLNETRRRSQARAEHASAEAAAANRVKDEFLAMVSHELRTPLSAILGWTKILRTREADPSITPQALEIIERNAATESRLVEDLLDISRLATGHFRLHMRPLEITPVLHAAIDTVRPAIEAKALDLRTKVDGTAMVLGDQERLQQVLWNLLSNAVKFTPERGAVEVVVQQVNTHARILVSDTGPGIDAAALPHIFERFHQGSQADGKRRGGLGLGLAIARHVAELHGGTLRAESAGRGKGARFVLELPTLADRAQPVATVR